MRQAEVNYNEAQAQRDFEDGFEAADFAEYEQLGAAEVARRMTAREAPFHQLNRQRTTAEAWLRQREA